MENIKWLSFNQAGLLDGHFTDKEYYEELNPEDVAECLPVPEDYDYSMRLCRIGSTIGVDKESLLEKVEFFLQRPEVNSVQVGGRLIPTSKILVDFLISRLTDIRIKLDLGLYTEEEAFIELPLAEKVQQISYKEACEIFLVVSSLSRKQERLLESYQGFEGTFAETTDDAVLAKCEALLK